MTRQIIDYILLAAAALNLAFIIRYALLSNWRQTFLGRNLMMQKIVLTIICLIFPIANFLHEDSGTPFDWVQVALFVVIIGTFVVDIFQLVHAQRYGRNMTQPPEASRGAES